MRILLLILSCFFSIVLISQPCSLVEITTTPLLILPECNDDNGAAFFSDTQGGTPPYTYEFNGVRSQFGSFSQLTIGVYTLIITDARSCSDTLSIELLYQHIEDIISPNNAFTPNGDDINDTWFIPGIESFKASEVKVFNRWGQLVHSNSEYSNEFGWDGTQNGSDLPPATYFYVISIINNCLEEYLKGTVTIVR